MSLDIGIKALVIVFCCFPLFGGFAVTISYGSADCGLHGSGLIHTYRCATGSETGVLSSGSREEKRFLRGAQKPEIVCVQVAHYSKDFASTGLIAARRILRSRREEKSLRVDNLLGPRPRSVVYLHLHPETRP